MPAIMIGISLSCSQSRREADQNILAALSWQAGESTTLSVATGRAKATAQSASVNPRIIKGPFTLTNGATYRMTGNLFKGDNSGNMVLRISTDPGVGSGDVKEIQSAATELIDETFVVSTAAPVYFGFIAIVNAIGQFAEIDDSFSITLEP